MFHRSQATEGRAAWLFVLVDDVDALNAELVAKGVVISLAPTEQNWGNREMYVNDPDGNGIRFVQYRG